MTSKTIYRATTPQDPEQWRWVTMWIRRALGAEFPRVKFQLRKCRLMSSAVRIGWSSREVAVSDVERVVEPFRTYRGAPLTPLQAERGYVLGVSTHCPHQYSDDQ